MRQDDGVLRLIPCEACDGTGDKDGMVGRMLDLSHGDSFIGGIPPSCPICRGRGVVSWPELQAYREKEDKEWNESGFGKILQRHAEEFVNHQIKMIEREELIKETGIDCYERNG